MMNWLKQGAYALAAALVGVAVAAAPTPAAAQPVDRLLGVVEPVKAKKKYRIAYASADLNAAFFVSVAYGVVDEADKAGVELVRVFSAGGYGNVAEQIAQLESAGSMNLDAVILLSTAFDGFDKALERLTQKGTKVILLGAPVNSKNASLIIAQDEPGLGRMMAGHICKQKPGAKVITLPGPPGVAWNKLRFDGFQDEAKKCNLNLVGNVFKGHIALEEGQAQASDLLLKFGDADYIYAVAGVVGVGAAQAAKRMKHKAKVVTAVVAKETVELIREGHIEMAVAEPAILFGRASVQYAVRVLNGDATPGLVPGIFPYPAAFVRNLELTKDKLDKYDLYAYDNAPDGWKPPVR